jgi:hypothetical protein
VTDGFQAGRAYRRKTIAEAGEFETFAAMEDDFHHFTVRVRHDGRRVTSVEGGAVRFPWSTCPGATAKLRELVSAPLRPTPDDPGPKPPIAQQCTHLFDIAKFAIAQSARGGRRQYDVFIPDPLGGRTTGEIGRDGAPLLKWEVKDRVVVAPASFAGHSLKGRAEWPAGAIADADMLEAALMLRRALVIFRGRVSEYPSVTKADQVPGGFGTCFTYQPENAAHGRWVMEEMDYTASAEPLLADFGRMARGGQQKN